ncbi:MAG: glycosyl hydrolase family 57, partial [Thermodesulfobacteriota bacterium]
MTRSGRLKLVLAATVCVCLVFGCEYETVYFSFGQHVDFYHSYRGDSPDEDGFGKDIRVITETLDILDQYPMVKMSWEFDSWQTLEHRLPEYAPELFDRIKARIAEKDEVRFMSWNGGLASAETPEEFAAGIGWQRQNLLDLFGKVENGVYPQEMMHTPSLIRAYGDLGIEWVSLFYSASSFTAFRNEVPLSGRELYNPLWLETPEGDARMIVLPTYHHSDVADFLGMASWARVVGTSAPGDSLIFINFDADGESWPVILKLFLPGLVKRPFVKFCTPGEYIAEHEPVGTIVLHRDQADGVFDGYSSWAEKPINHEIWTAVE